MTTAVSTTTAFTAPAAASSAAPLPTPSPDVVFRAMPDGGVLFAPQTEVYYGLNTTGAFVWERLSPVCRTVDELCAALVAQYPDATAEQVRLDVQGILDDLVAGGLAVQA